MQYIFFSLLQLGGVQRGEVDIQLGGNDDFKCKYLSFSSSFSGGTPVQVFASTNRGNRSSGVHDSAFIWVEDVSTTRFKVCLVQGGKGYGDNITIDWFAFQGSQAGVYHGQASFSLFTTGSKCERLTFSQVRSLYVYSCNYSVLHPSLLSSIPSFLSLFLPSFLPPSLPSLVSISLKHFVEILGVLVGAQNSRDCAAWNSKPKAGRYEHLDS